MSATLHKGSKGASKDLSTMIEEHPCSSVYFVLEECLGVHDRDWRACQAEVAALKLCNKNLPPTKKNKDKQEPQG